MATKKTDQTEERIHAVEEALSKTEKFIEDNQKVLLYILLGIVIIVLAIMGYSKYYKAPREIKAQQQIYVAEKYFEKDSLNKALNGDGNYPGFKTIVAKYGNTKAGNLAHYYLGVIYLKQGEFNKAIEELKDFSSDDKIIGPLALGATADAYMELKQTEKAADYYLEAAEHNTNNFTTPMFLFKAGLAYEECGKLKKAHKLYTRIKKEFFRSNEGREIDKYISFIENNPKFKNK